MKPRFAGTAFATLLLLAPQFTFAVSAPSGPPFIYTQPASLSVSVGAAALLTVGASGSPAPTYQWLKNGKPVALATSNTLTFAAAAIADAAAYTVVVSNSKGAVASLPATLSVSSKPVVVTGPQSQSVTAGSAVTFSVVTNGAGLSYEWRFNGTKLAGATSATLPLANVGTDQAGAYSVTVISGTKTDAVEVAALTVSSDAWISALSLQDTVGEGNQTMELGFVLAGSESSQVLIRGDGPALAELGLTGVLADPKLTLRETGAVVGENAGWNNDPTLSAAFSEVGAFPFPANSLDAALLENLGAGTYTATIAGQKHTSGTALGELFFGLPGVSPGTATAVSAKAYLNQASADSLTTGFAVSGTTSITLHVKVTGTASRGAAVTLYNATNTAITPSSSTPRSFEATLPPGAYTIQVTDQGRISGAVKTEITVVP